MNKKGVNVILGYVLLIAAVIAMGAIVYQWLKSYVPSEVVECPEEVSIMIKDVSCNPLKFTLKNNGLFNIDGYYVKGATSASQELATTNVKSGGGYFELNNVLEPGEEIIVDKSTEYQSTNIYFFEITPIRFQKDDEGELYFAVCGNSKVKESTGSCSLR